MVKLCCICDTRFDTAERGMSAITCDAVCQAINQRQYQARYRQSPAGKKAEQKRRRTAKRRASIRDFWKRKADQEWYAKTSTLSAERDPARVA